MLTNESGGGVKIPIGFMLPLLGRLENAVHGHCSGLSSRGLMAHMVGVALPLDRNLCMVPDLRFPLAAGATEAPRSG